MSKGVPNMDQPRPDLVRIQRWMQSVISHPDGIEQGISSAEARAEIDVPLSQIEQVILPSQHNSSVDRLKVYGNAYYARLLECLRESFPVTAKMLGKETFDQFAFGYLQQFPSTSYTLGRLGDSFFDYLQQTRPDREQRAAGEISWPDLLIDLAHLEWTIEQVFDGPGVEHAAPLSVEQLAAIPVDRWEEARLVPVECLRLLKFSFPVNEYFTAVRNDESPPMPSPEPSWLGVTRRDYIVRRIPLSRPQYVLLSALQHGVTVGEAIERAAKEVDDLDRLAADLRQWFHQWAAAQLFARIEFAE